MKTPHKEFFDPTKKNEIHWLDKEICSAAFEINKANGFDPEQHLVKDTLIVPLRFHEETALERGEHCHEKLAEDYGVRHYIVADTPGGYVTLTFCRGPKRSMRELRGRIEDIKWKQNSN